MRYWRCTVCGYIHEGAEPPEQCPVCKAPREKFEELPQEEGKKAKQEYEAKRRKKPAPSPAGESREKKVEERSPGGIYSTLTGLMVRRHAHPISTHFPNGVVPVAVLFLLLSLVFTALGFDKASFYNLAFVALVLPGVLFTGYIEWRLKYGGSWTPLFKVKIASAVAVSIICWGLVGWRLADPGLAEPGQWKLYAFVASHLVLLGAVALAGHLGGKLVFKD